MKGYKQMLRDRMPLMLDLALKWCKAKERWIDYVYDNIVRRYPVEKRSMAVKIVLGLKQNYTRTNIYDHMRYVQLKPITKEQVNNIPKSKLYMSFHDTIDWEKLSEEDADMYTYWKNVESWVNWFKTTHIYIEDTYSHSRSFGNDEETTKSIIISKYGISSKLVDYLIKSFN